VSNQWHVMLMQKKRKSIRSTVQRAYTAKKYKAKCERVGSNRGLLCQDARVLMAKKKESQIQDIAGQCLQTLGTNRC